MMSFTGAKQVEVASVPAQPSSKDNNFLFQREAGGWTYLKQAFVVMVLVFGALFLGGWKFNKGTTVAWAALFSNALFWAWIVGSIYFGYSLWRWSKLAWLEELFGVNLDRNPSVGNGETKGKRPTMFVKIQFDDGEIRTADSGIEEKDRRFILEIARATLAGRGNSQVAMKRSVGMSRPKHERIMRMFVKLGILKKKDESVSNSHYVMTSPEKKSRAVLRAISMGEFKMLEDVWDGG